VVIDGYVHRDGSDFFHVNFGWFGRSDGWYILDEDLPSDTKEIALILIFPDAEREKQQKKENRQGYYSNHFNQLTNH
jgi:hypothetical protein